MAQHVVDKINPSKVDKNSRRCDPENPNRILTVGFGFGSEKGTSEHQIDHRVKTFYRDYFGKKQPNLSNELSNQIIKERNDFNLKNKFEYGFD